MVRLSPIAFISGMESIYVLSEISKILLFISVILIWILVELIESNENLKEMNKQMS